MVSIWHACHRWIKSMLHYGTSINNGPTKLKINFTCCYVSVKQNIFPTSIAYYLKGITWWDLDFLSYPKWMPNISPFKKFQFSCQNVRFPNWLTYWNGSFWHKISKFKNLLICYIHIGDGKKIMFHYGTSIKNCQMKLKINFTLCYIVLYKIFF